MKRHHAPRRVVIESLEVRRLFSAPMKVLGVLTITPNANADHGKAEVHTVTTNSQPAGHGLSNAAENSPVLTWTPSTE
jgi:hypothetical protein